MGEMENLELVLENTRLRLEISALNGKNVQLSSFVDIQRKRAVKAESELKEETEAHRKSMSTYLDFVRLFIEKDKELQEHKDLLEHGR